MSATKGALSSHLQATTNFFHNSPNCIVDDFIVENLFGAVNQPNVYVQTLCCSLRGEAVFAESIGLAGASFQQVTTHSTLNVALGDNNEHRHRGLVLVEGGALLDNIAVGMHKAALAANKKPIGGFATKSLGFTKCMSYYCAFHLLLGLVWVVCFLGRVAHCGEKSCGATAVTPQTLPYFLVFLSLVAGVVPSAGLRFALVRFTGLAS